MLPPFQCQGCNKHYWPKQVWMHAKCVVVDKVMVVDTASNVVVDKIVNRKADRHKKTEARKIYQRNWVRDKRVSPQRNPAQ